MQTKTIWLVVWETVDGQVFHAFSTLFDAEEKVELLYEDFGIDDATIEEIVLD